MEPINPDKYYVFHGFIELDGKKGYAKVKKWVDEDGKAQERILSFDGVEKGEENA